MRNHKELKKLIVLKLEKFSIRNYSPTAKEIYHQVRECKPAVARRGFKSFVRVMNTFPEVKKQEVGKGRALIYKLK